MAKARLIRFPVPHYTGTASRCRGGHAGVRRVPREVANFRQPCLGDLLRCAGPGHCASCGLRAFYVHGTRRATHDAHIMRVRTRMRVAMVRSCRRCRAGACFHAMPPARPHCHAYYELPCILYGDVGVTRSVKICRSMRGGPSHHCAVCSCVREK